MIYATTYAMLLQVRQWFAHIALQTQMQFRWALPLPRWVATHVVPMDSGLFLPISLLVRSFLPTEELAHLRIRGVGLVRNRLTHALEDNLRTCMRSLR